MDPVRKPLSESDLNALRARVDAAARELNRAMRAAAELDLRVRLTNHREDLDGDAEARMQWTPAVHVRIDRRK